MAFSFRKQNGYFPQQPKRKTARKALICIGVVLVALLVAAAYAIQHWGGNGIVPSWQQLYRMLGQSTSAPDKELLQDSATTVSFLDVGQGDSVLIGQDGEYCLIDAGGKDTQDLVVQDLLQAGVKRLKLVVITHPHADHIGGMNEILNQFPVDTVLLPDLTLAPFESYAMDKILRTIQNDGLHAVTAQAGQEYPIGTGSLTVLYTGIAENAESSDDAVNDTSLCLMFRAGDFAFLDTGDAEEAEEQAMLKEVGAKKLRCTLFKAGHHGSSTSSTQQLLQAAKPKAVAISCGTGNEYGHPHQSALRRFDAVGAQVWRTDLLGTLTFVPRGKGVAAFWTQLEPAEQEQKPAA